MAPLISLMELHQVVAIYNIEQVYIVTHLHSFLFAFESFKYLSDLNNVSIDETINENVFERDTQKQHLGGNPCLEKHV